MQKIILLSLILIFTGCEMHEQQSSGQVKRDQKVVNLSVIEELTSAIIRNDLDQLSQILKNGNFDVNVPNKSGELLLNKAINSKRFVITFRLLESGADPDLRDDTGVNARELAQLSEQEKDWELLFSEYKIILRYCVPLSAPWRFNVVGS
jgi:ankyrin repeat protein